MEDLSWLQDMIADDDLGLLNVKKKTSALTADEQLVSKFNEINYFVAPNLSYHMNLGIIQDPLLKSINNTQM